MSNDTIVRVENLVAKYDDFVVLNGVSCSVRRGEIFVIIGGSGCGKTTLLKHMTGLLQPADGHVWHGETDITTLNEEELAEIQQSMGIAFQSGALFNSMTVGENVALPLRESGVVDKDIIEPLVYFKLGMVGLGHAVHSMPSELSGGMRKRAGFARAIALDPPIVFFDEPSAGLDPILGAGLDNLILDLKELLGITVVIVTHELESIRAVADHVIMLDQGEVIFDGSLDDVDSCEHPRVHQFFERRPDERLEARNHGSES